MTAWRDELELELARQRAILERNEAKRWDRATPARSRFAYAAHATKARNRIARLELELAAAAPSPSSIDRARVDAGVCRHCGGPVPCWSPFGDVVVGRRHPMRRS